MREAWRELTFADTEQEAKATRDPVAAAQRSDSALAKISSRQLPDSSVAHSFKTLMAELATLVRNTCRTPGSDPLAPTFQVTTRANPTQQKALDLIQAIRL
jgi:hypothetical protein